MKEIQIDGRTVRFFRGAGEDLPTVYATNFMDEGEAVLNACRDRSCPPFNYVTIHGIEWDACLSPWPSAPVVNKSDDFRGLAKDYLSWCEEKVLPQAGDYFGGRRKQYISGYSMGGLFALWSLYETTAFDGAVCASGSLWYPDFRDFAVDHDLKGAVDGIYLSLGDRESKTKNPALRQNQSIFEELREVYTDRGIPCVFELNKGNNFVDGELRVAKGITWLLQQA